MDGTAELTVRLAEVRYLAARLLEGQCATAPRSITGSWEDPSALAAQLDRALAALEPLASLLAAPAPRTARALAADATAVARPVNELVALRDWAHEEIGRLPRPARRC